MRNRFLSLFVVITTILLVSSVVSAEETITFQLLRGRAALNRQGVGNWLDLGPEPIVVRVQDRLRTESETRGEMKFPDGSIFRVKSNTILTLMDGGIQMQVGEAIFNLQKQGRNFQVVTPTAVCGVLGTSFDVNVDRFGKTQVRVFDGIVAVKTHGQERRQLVLQRGMMTAVQRQGSLEAQPQRFDPTAAEGQLKKDWGGVTPLGVGPNRAPLPQPSRPGTNKTSPAPGKTPDAWQNLQQQRQEGQPPMRDGESRLLPPVTDPRQAGVRENVEGLPPMRPGTTSAGPGDPGFRPSTPSAMPTAAEPPNIRENMSFFETLQRQQNPNRPPTPPPPGPGMVGYADPRFRRLNQDQMQEGHGRSFGQAGPGMLVTQDNQRLREELNLTQNQLVRTNEEIARVQAEIEQVRQQLAQAAARSQATTSRLTTTLPGTAPTAPTTTGAVPTAPTTGTTSPTTATSLTLLQDRLRALEERMRILRDQQQKLLIRLNDLRNRLH